MPCARVKGEIFGSIPPSVGGFYSREPAVPAVVGVPSPDINNYTPFYKGVKNPTASNLTRPPVT